MAVRLASIAAAVIALILLSLLVIATYTHSYAPGDGDTNARNANSSFASPDAATGQSASDIESLPKNYAEGQAPLTGDATGTEPAGGGGSGLRALAEGMQHAVAREMEARWPQQNQEPNGTEAIRGEESEIELRISGIVFNIFGEPLKGVTIVVNGTDNPLQTQSRSDGTFVLAGTLAPHELSSLPPAVTLEARGDSVGYGSQQKRHVPVNADNVQFDLDPLARVEGIVVDAVTGQPLTAFEARIGLVWEGEQYVAVPAHIGWVSFSSPDGAFRLTNYGPEKIALQARAPGYILSRTDFLTVPPGENLTGIVLRLERGEDFSGIVLDEKTRQPIESASVCCIQGQIFGAQPSVSSRVVLTGPDGAFLLPGDEGSAHSNLMATHPHYSPGFASNIAAEARQNLVIYMKKGGTLFGTVTSGGQPAREIGIIPKMTLTYPETTYSQGTGTDVRGEYRLTNLSEGTYAVRILGREGTTYGKVLAQIVSGMETRLDAELQDFAQLGGWVVGVDTYEDLEFFLSDVQLPEEILYNAGVREDGHFEYGRVLPGEYLINVLKKAPPRKRYTTVVTLGPGERPEITIDFSTIPSEDEETGEG